MEQTKQLKTEQWNISFFSQLYMFSQDYDIFCMNILEIYIRKSLVKKKQNRGI